MTMKKLLSLLLAMAMLFALAACGDRDNSGGTTEPSDDATEPGAFDESWKIGLITGTLSQSGEEYEAALQMKEVYGDRLEMVTYPDNFGTETETTIARALELANDEHIQAIVFVQAIPGAAAAIDKVREVRPDMLVICGVPGDDPNVISTSADIVLNSDEIAMGTTIMEQAAAMGATTFVHYSFPRHMSYATLAARREILIEKAAELGIEFIDETTPDPIGDQGLPGAQQFMIDDVPRKVAQYGADTAFFNTNCGMQEPLIKQVLDYGAIFPQQCCPSPFHGYPGALGINVQGHEGDVQYMMDQITTAVAAKGNEGRMSTWPFSINMLELEAGVRYAEKWITGEIESKCDLAAMTAIVHEVLGDPAMATVKTYVEKQVDGTDHEYENYFMIQGQYYTF